MAPRDQVETNLATGNLITTPREHYALLHGDPAPFADVVVWDGSQPGKYGKGIWNKLWAREDPGEKLDALDGQSDRYMTSQQFRRWKTKRLLRSLRCCYIDIDGTTDLDATVDHLREICVPEPSIVIYSGRGMHLYWLIDPVPKKSLILWEKVQKKIKKVLQTDELEGEPDARDCARLLRVCGTINSKNGQRVYGRVHTGECWTLRQLADEILGPRESYETRRFRPRRQAKRDKSGLAQDRDIRSRWPAGTPVTGYSRWRGVYRDLVRIAEHYGTIPIGYRQTWLFLAVNALSWFCDPESLHDEIERLIQRYTPDVDGPCAADLEHVIQRARDAAATDGDGNAAPVLDEWGFDRRYRMSRDYLNQEIGGLVPDAIATELRTIGSHQLADEQRRKRERRKKRAQRAGQHTPREDYEQQAREWQTRAQALAGQGWSPKAIAAEVGKDRSSVSRALKSPPESAPESRPAVTVQVCPPCTAPPAGGARSAGARKAAHGPAKPRTAKGWRPLTIDVPKAPGAQKSSGAESKPVERSRDRRERRAHGASASERDFFIRGPDGTESFAVEVVPGCSARSGASNEGMDVRVIAAILEQSETGAIGRGCRANNLVLEALWQG